MSRNSHTTQLLNTLCGDEDDAQSHWKSEQNRRASCTALDWFSGDLEWQAVASNCLENNAKKYDLTGSVDDIRHARVKSESPTVVHQARPFSVEAQSAEIMIVGEEPSGAPLSGAPSAAPANRSSIHSDGSTSSSSSSDQVSSLLLVKTVLF